MAAAEENQSLGSSALVPVTVGAADLYQEQWRQQQQGYSQMYQQQAQMYQQQVYQQYQQAQMYQQMQQYHAAGNDGHMQASQLLAAASAAEGGASAAKLAEDAGGAMASQYAALVQYQIASQQMWDAEHAASSSNSSLLAFLDDEGGGEAHIGIIARYDDKNGYGFIKCSETHRRFQRDVFLHKMHFNKVSVGDLVAFSLSISDKGMPQARRIRKLEGDQALAAERQLSTAGVLDQQYYTGSVARFDLSKGYGFIQCEATKHRYQRDVFLRKNMYIDMDLQLGELVTFQVELSEKGFPQARNVTRAGAWPGPAGAMGFGGGGAAAWQMLASGVAQALEMPPAEAPSQMPPRGLSDRVFSGTVVRFDAAAGFGFLQSAESQGIYGQDIFLHRSVCGDSELVARLQLNDALVFQVDVTDRGPQARNIRRPGEAPAQSQPAEETEKAGGWKVQRSRSRSRSRKRDRSRPRSRPRRSRSL